MSEEKFGPVFGWWTAGDITYLSIDGSPSRTCEHFSLIRTQDTLLPLWQVSGGGLYAAAVNAEQRLIEDWKAAHDA